MNLLKPIKFVNQPTIVTLSPDFQYLDQNLLVQVKSTLHAVMIFDLKGQEVAEFTVPNFSTMEKTVFTNYVKVQQFLNICANAGERVNQRLLAVLPMMSPDVKKTDLLKLDFMKLRKLFSDFFKKNIIYRSEPIFDSNAKRDNITSTFYDFILCRNYYTHGILKVVLPTKKYYIEYIEEGKENMTAEINQTILQSFLNIADQIVYVLDRVRTIHQEN